MTMQNRISSNTNLVAFSRDGKRTMDTLIPIYAGCGYKALDLNFCEMMNPGSVLNTEKCGEYIKKLKEEKEIHGLEYIQAHAPYPRDYTVLDKEEKNASDALILKAMDAAAELGVPHIVVHPIKGSIKENIGYFESLIERQHTPVKIAIENMETRNEIWSAEDLISICRSLEPMAGICLDTGHAFIAGEDIPSFIKKTGDLLIGTHIADNDGKEDLHLLPGFGKIKWEEVVKALKDSYSGYLNYECMFFSKNLPWSLSEDIVRLSLSIGSWLLSL